MARPLRAGKFYIKLNPTIGDGTIKTAIMSLIKTCITSLQHISSKLSFNTWQSLIPLTEVCGICHHKLFPCGRDKAKLCTTSYRAGYIEKPGTTTKETRLGHCMREWAPVAQKLHVNFLQIERVSWILRLRIFLQSWKAETQTHT